MFQHNNDPVQKATFMKIGFSMIGVEGIECPAQRPDLNLTECLWDELEHCTPGLLTHQCPASVMHVGLNGLYAH